MLFFENLAAIAPRGFGGRLGHREEVASLHRERCTSFFEETPPRHVFPICGVQRELPDIVAATLRAPRGNARGDSANGLLQIRTVPGFLFVGFAQELEQKRRVSLSCVRRHRDLLRMKLSETIARMKTRYS